MGKKESQELIRELEIIKTATGTFLIDNGDLISNTLKHSGIWEQWLHIIYTKLIQKDWVVVDVGANIGTHTIPMAELCKQVYAFEPQKNIFNQLCANIALNGLDFNITPVGKGLGNKNEIKQIWDIKFEVNDDIKNHKGQSLINWGGRGIEQESCVHNYNPNETREIDQIEVITLDSYNLKQCDLIKIDIQGWELFALQGAKNTLKKYKPTLLLENGINEGPELEQNKECLKLLSDMGYEIYRQKFDVEKWESMKLYNNDDCIIIHPKNKYHNYVKTILEGAPDGFFFELEKI